MKAIIPILSILVALFISPNTAQANPANSVQEPSFYRVPLVCNAAPFGCGSRSKPVLLDLEKSEAVKEAWLNRVGTVIAVVWQEGISIEDKSALAEKVFKERNVNAESISGEDFDIQLASFSAREDWYQGAEVDQLTIEESALITEEIMSRLNLDEIIPVDKVAPMQQELNNYIEKSLLEVTSADQLNRSFYNEWEKETFRLGEEYLGAGNMPEVQLYGPAPTNEKEGKASCSSSCTSKSSCCSNKKTQN